MTHVPGALAFLVARTVRNRFTRQLARVKSPRYAIALLLGLAYMWMVFLRPDRQVSLRPSTLGTTLPSVAGIGFALTAIWWWLKGGAASALAFQPAEVQLLFPAPLTRRHLLAYKIVRSQLLILLNAVIWTVLMRRWGLGLSSPQRFATAWGLFSVLSFHRLLAALVQTEPVTGVRRVVRPLMQLLAGAALAGIVIGLVPAVKLFTSEGVGPAFRAMGAALREAPAAWSLAPFHLVLAPLAAATLADWARAFAPVLALIGLHAALVMRLDGVPFEEAAATASADLAKRVAVLKERRAGGAMYNVPKKASRAWIPLRATGTPWVAIAWKNTLALLRTGSLRVLALLLVFAFVAGRLGKGDDGGAARAGLSAAMPWLMFAGLFFVMGPRLVRNDLRQDLLQLAQLKTWPVRGAWLVLAEVASPTLVLAVAQLVVLAGGVWALPQDALAPWPRGYLAACGVVVPFAVLALNALSVAIQNGTALMFPTWVRLGPDSGGIEAIGQNLLVMILSLVALVLGLVAPLAAAGVVRGIAADSLGAWAWPAAALSGVVALFAETGFLVLYLGYVFERTDPTALA